MMFGFYSQSGTRVTVPSRSSSNFICQLPKRVVQNKLSFFPKKGEENHGSLQSCTVCVLVHVSSYLSTPI